MLKFLIRVRFKSGGFKEEVYTANTYRAAQQTAIFKHNNPPAQVIEAVELMATELGAA